MYSVFANPSRLAQTLAFCVAGLCINTGASANPTEFTTDSPGQIHGFLGQSLLQSTANNFFGNTDSRVSHELQEFGINGSYRINGEWLVSGQLLSRHAGESDKGNPQVDYLFTSYTPFQNDDQSVSILLGKTKIPYGLYNDVRDTPGARPSIVLPQSIYLDRLRDAYQSGIGGQVIGEQTFEDGGYVTAQYIAFKLQADGKNPTQGLLGTRPQGNLSGQSSWTSQLMYHSAGDKVRLGLTRAAIRLDYATGQGDTVYGLQPGKVEFAPWIFSALWQEERWSLAAEYLKRTMRYTEFGANRVVPNRDVPGQSYYLQGTWRFTPKLEGLVRYDVYYMNSDDKSGEATAALTKMPSWTYYAKDWTVGLRYRFQPGWHVSGEIHSVDGAGWLAPADTPNPATTSRHWNLFLLQLGYQF